MLRRLTWIVLVVGLVACANSVPTQRMPTIAPPPPNPLADSAVVQAGDLPATYHTRADPMPWRIYPNIPTTSAVAYYEIIQGSDEANEVGHIAVLHYEDTETADAAYAAVQAEAELDKQTSSLTFGETGSQSGPTPDWNGSDVLFRRCNTVVHVALNGNTVATLVPLAQQIDTRLQPLVCE